MPSINNIKLARLSQHVSFAPLFFALFLFVNINHKVLADNDPKAFDPVKTMQAKYAAFEPQLKQNQFNRPLVLESAEIDHRLKGDIYAVVNYPIATVATGLNNPEHWCDIMHLHINTKYCHVIKGAESDSPATKLRIYIGKKIPEDLADAKRVEFNYMLATSRPDYLQINLSADEGPLGTSDYRIILEAIALSKTKTFLHLTYSYAVSVAGRIAMQTYLATVGHGKVGFTITGKQADGQPDYIGGVRGLMERNTMRYYLAIDSYLDSANSAPDGQLEKRLLSWYSATEKYPRQLHELDQSDYVEMKRAEYVRQQAVH
ncbi:hypothetical protein LPB67_08710 [Undibacterium sp. Jales W-56]|uniref:hypothetical protein n=1 Tax=Undibacterium sp. Jales W-56 TaxID=2897325 RepID=UPI0021D0643F|nr:hypothetical protein [Undibacterium sp. Jales W-56]MCU6433857.1 hypothetical protein [Undibacterium sp. Jales W-56]